MNKTIAIIPPTVSIAAGRKTDAEAIKEQQKTESLNFQKEMYAWMLKRKKQGKMTQEILTRLANAKILIQGKQVFKPKVFSEFNLVFSDRITE